MKIYDCFIFFNEIDLLEIRLKTLEKVVDFFVLVESTKTHRDKDKPLYFNESKKRFKRWEDKIIHVVVDDMPKIGRSYGSYWKLNSFLKGGPWKLEAYQKKQIIRGLKNCRDEDIVMMSDLDEIPNPKKISEMIEKLKTEKIVLFSQNLYYFFLNGFTLSGWIGTRACTFRTLRKLFWMNMDWFRHLWNIPLRVRMLFGKKIYRIRDGGWHFSYLGNEKFISNKISSSAHFEKDKPEFSDTSKIKEKIDSGKDLFDREFKITYVPIDSTFPEEVFKNKKKYSKLIKKI